MKRVAALLFVTACASSRPAIAPAPSAPVPIAKEAGFYPKHIELGGIAIRAHASVSDEALSLTRDRLARVLEHAPRIRRNLERNHFEVHVSGLRQQASDLPEFARRKGERLPNGQLFDEHMIGGHIVAYTTVCTEATVIGVVGHRLYGNDSCTHELGHGIEVSALSPAVRARLLSQWERSHAAGLWKNEYADSSYAEMFAEGTRFYFTERARLESRDPELFALMRDLYTDAIDPGDAPTEQPVRLGRQKTTAACAARRRIRRCASASATSQRRSSACSGSTSTASARRTRPISSMRTAIRSRSSRSCDMSSSSPMQKERP